MTAHHVFIASAVIGFVGWIGFFVERLSGRMTRFTRWKDLTNLQWVYCYAMVQFAAVIVVSVLYHGVKNFAS